ncbi:MAG: hypothetical protein JRI91_16025 [Deltaproteobacteria bacterium]|nr:hypothetical protein [Deltaproteobacteria bacterium]
MTASLYDDVKPLYASPLVRAIISSVVMGDLIPTEVLQGFRSNKDFFVFLVARYYQS